VTEVAFTLVSLFFPVWGFFLFSFWDVVVYAESLNAGEKTGK
jgi:hypothetical protein